MRAVEQHHAGTLHLNIPYKVQRSHSRHRFYLTVKGRLRHILLRSQLFQVEFRLFQMLFDAIYNGLQELLIRRRIYSQAF